MSKLFLSASRIKTFSSCSWKYWASYHLKIPEESNDGARRGSVVHDFLECVLKQHRKHYYDYIIKNKTPKGLPVLERFISALAIKNELVNEIDNKGVHNIDLVYEMIYNGIRYDFYLEGWDLQEPEESFEHESDYPYYKIRGFIDKYGRKEKKAKIVDYKTSSSVEGKDHEIQSMIYSLWALRVKQLDAFIEFQFLRFNEDNVVKFDYDKEELEGIEYWLEEVQYTLENMDEEMAQTGFAYDKGFVNGFAGRVMCGMGHTESQLKKDGTPYYSCPFKWPTEYWVQLDDDGEIMKSSLTKEGLDGNVEKRTYSGCPKFN